MRLVRVGAAALNQTPLDWAGNLARCREAIRRARAAGVDVLCLPELCLTGYGCEDMFAAPWVVDRAAASLAALLPDTAGMVVCVGLPLRHRGAVFDAAALIADGRLLGFAAKQFLAADGIHYEPRWFEAWAPEVAAQVELDGARYPVGDLLFDVGGVRIAFEICEDAWVAARPGARHALDGVDLLLNPSASHFAFGKLRTRERFVIEGSRAFGCTYIYTNLLGNEAGRAIYDGGALIATAGELVAYGPWLSFAEVAVTSALVDIDQTRLINARTRSFHPDLADPMAREVRHPFAWPDHAARTTTPDAPVALVHATKSESFLRAEALGLFDYLRKSRSQGFVISLSGGADSAACAVLCAAAAHLAWAELGAEGVRQRLAFLRGVEAIADAPALAHRLITTVYQGTRNSGAVTRNAAAAVAAGIGAHHLELEVDALVEGYERVVSGALGLELTWADHDIARQNVQARARAPSVWMLANLAGALLLTTSNRSEAAVGYATMDGDTAGGLAPIAGVDKAFLREWLRWLEHAGVPGFGPVPALSAINAQQPTAELRPAAMNQTDEGDLMPYPILEEVEEEAIGHRRSPVEVLHLLRLRHPEVAVAQLAAWTERFFRLWTRNQWKRERYAPSFHLDDRNLDPRSWCRFPILSSGFEEELATLRAEAARW
jgi:NAD+ synthase (glutamine-hydrolysing)